MSNPENGHNFVPWENVAHYLRARQPVIFPVSSAPARVITYEVDGTDASVSLLVELARGERCPRSPSLNIEVTEVASRGIRCARIRTTSPELIRDFHDLAFAVADRIVRDKAPLIRALRDTIRSWHRLIDVRTANLGRQVGLHGELAVLYSIAQDRGWETAIAAWVGPHGEVHDFSLSEFDLEVKTASSETRKHTVNGVEQLTPKTGRALWFASIQLARGGAAGRSLSQSIDTCLDAARAVSPDLEARLAQALTAADAESLALTDSEAEDRWVVRSEPLVLRSSDTPHIDPVTFLANTPDRISHVTYDIDLTGLPPSTDSPVDLQDIQLP